MNLYPEPADAGGSPVPATPLDPSAGSPPAIANYPFAGIPGEAGPAEASDPVAPPTRRSRRRALLGGVMLAGVLAIGGFLTINRAPSGTNDGVATLQTQSAGSARPSASAGSTDAYGQMLAFAQCMRAHGVTSFPDPQNDNGQGAIMVQGGTGTDIDPEAATYQAAQEACQSLMPEGPTSAQPDPKMQQQMLAFSQCMRDNGVPNYPDPVLKGNSVSMSLPAGIDPSSPAFKAAQEKCQTELPMAGFGPSTTVGGTGGSAGSGPSNGGQK